MMSVAPQHAATFRLPHFLLLAIILVLILPLAVGVAQNTAHGEKAHAGDYDLINDCLQRHGPSMILQSRSHRRENQFWRLCQLDDGRWGVQLVERVAKGWRERTAFVPKDGTWARVWEYLSAKAIRVWPGG